MKKLIILVLSILFLTACGSSVSQVYKEEEQDKKVSREEVENGNIENDEKDDDDREKNEKEEEPTQEEVAKEYRLDDVYSLVPINDATEDVVLITIDDAPDKHGLEMAKTLKELDAPAIFFVNGHFLTTPEKEDVLKEIHEMGFAIGNHTYGHENLQTLSEEEQREQIVSVSDRIEEIIGERPKFFRAPHGANTDFSKALVAEEKMLLMNWTYGYDYFEPYMDKDKIVEAMVSGAGPEVNEHSNSLLRPGANLLMHDREWTNAGLKEIIEGLREKGYEPLDPNLIEVPAQE